MANKVLTIGNTTSTSKNEEIYVDLDMNSKQIPPVSRPNIENYYEFNEKHTKEQVLEDLEKEELDITEQDIDGLNETEQYKESPIEKKKEGWNFSVSNYKAYLNKNHYQIKKSVNIRAVQNSLDNIFRWIPGERILNPEFGTRLRELLYEGITDLNRERVAAEVRSCVSKWEPRVNITKLTHIDKILNAEDNTVELDIEYTIVGLEDQVFHKQYLYDRNS